MPTKERLRDPFTAVALNIVLVPVNVSLSLKLFLY